MDEVYEFLKKCGTYYLGTVDGTVPKVRPFGTIDSFNGKLYIQTGKCKDVSKQLHANPNAEICCFDGQRWLRIGCRLIEDDSREAREHMLNAYPNLRAMYNEDDGNTEVFFMKDATAVFSSFSAAPVTVNF